MEIVFTICLLMVPVISIATAFLCLDNMRKIKQLKGIVKVLTTQVRTDNQMSNADLLGQMTESL